MPAAQTSLQVALGTGISHGNVMVVVVIAMIMEPIV